MPRRGEWSKAKAIVSSPAGFAGVGILMAGRGFGLQWANDVCGFKSAIGFRTQG
jgi:hypothetical protein